MIQRKISIMCPRIKFLQLKDDKYDTEGYQKHFIKILRHHYRGKKVQTGMSVKMTYSSGRSVNRKYPLKLMKKKGRLTM